MKEKSVGKLLRNRPETGPANGLHTAVIIPFFNDMVKLGRAVGSLLEQTHRPDTIVLVDDCGKERLDDGIRRSIEEAGVELLLIENRQNLGPGGSRQAGMDALPADTDYVMFLDSDDYLSPNCLEALVEAHHRESGLVATYADSRNIHTGERRLDEGREPFDNLLDGMLRGPRGWGTGSLLWRFPEIRGIRWPSMRTIEDSHFELSAALVNPRIRYVPEATIHIDQSWEPERLVRRNRHMNEFHSQRILELYERILRNYPFNNEEARRKNYLRLAVYHWSRKSKLTGFEYLKEALTYIGHGRWRITFRMLYYFPKYGFSQQTRR